MLSRLDVEKYLKEHGDWPTAVAALLEDHPDSPYLEYILNDASSYELATGVSSAEVEENIQAR